MCCKAWKSKLNSKLHHCFVSSNVAKENGKEFRIENLASHQVCRLEVDGCYIDNDNKVKCDYAFLICQSSELILVELKGNDVVHAVKQIVETYKELKNSGSSFSGFIVSSSVPKATESRFRKLQDEVQNKFGFLIKKVHHKTVIKK